MSEALKAAVLDLKMLRPYLKMVPVMLVLGIVMDISMKTGLSFVVLYAATLIMTLSAYPFGAEEKNRLHLLRLSLPVTRRAIVAGRYLQAASVSLVFSGIAFVLSFIASLVAGRTFAPAETALTALGVCAFALTVVMFQYPIYYRIGFMKARYLVNVPLFLIILLLPQIKALQSSARGGAPSRLIAFLSAHPMSAVLILLALAALLGLLSFLLSYHFFKKKDLS